MLTSGTWMPLLAALPLLFVVLAMLILRWSAARDGAAGLLALALASPPIFKL